MSLFRSILGLKPEPRPSTRRRQRHTTPPPRRTRRRYDDESDTASDAGRDTDRVLLPDRQRRTSRIRSHDSAFHDSHRGSDSSSRPRDKPPRPSGMKPKEKQRPEQDVVDHELSRMFRTHSRMEEGDANTNMNDHSPRRSRNRDLEQSSHRQGSTAEPTRKRTDHDLPLRNSSERVQHTYDPSPLRERTPRPYARTRDDGQYRSRTSKAAPAERPQHVSDFLGPNESAPRGIRTVPRPEHVDTVPWPSESSKTSKYRPQESRRETGETHKTLSEGKGKAAATSQAPPEPLLNDCDICLTATDPNQLVKLDCPHTWCSDCLKRSFFFEDDRPIVKDVACCGIEIPIPKITFCMTRTEQATWNRRMREATTTRPIYCPTPKCGGYWISPNHYSQDSKGRKTAKCPLCKNNVCRRCRKGADNGHSCRDDEDDQKFKEWADKKGAKKCPKCKRFVERVSGCSHMTCHCGQEWCWTCEKAYVGASKQCTCPMTYTYPEHPEPGLHNPYVNERPDLFDWWMGGRAGRAAGNPDWVPFDRLAARGFLPNLPRPAGAGYGHVPGGYAFDDHDEYDYEYEHDGDAGWARTDWRERSVSPPPRTRDRALRPDRTALIQDTVNMIRVASIMMGIVRILRN